MSTAFGLFAALPPVATILKTTSLVSNGLSSKITSMVCKHRHKNQRVNTLKNLGEKEFHHHNNNIFMITHLRLKLCDYCTFIRYLECICYSERLIKAFRRQRGGVVGPVARWRKDKNRLSAAHSDLLPEASWVTLKLRPLARLRLELSGTTLLLQMFPQVVSDNAQRRPRSLFRPWEQIRRSSKFNYKQRFILVQSVIKCKPAPVTAPLQQSQWEGLMHFSRYYSIWCRYQRRKGFKLLKGRPV